MSGFSAKRGTSRFLGLLKETQCPNGDAPVVCFRLDRPQRPLCKSIADHVYRDISDLWGCSSHQRCPAIFLLPPCPPSHSVSGWYGPFTSMTLWRESETRMWEMAPMVVCVCVAPKNRKWPPVTSGETSGERPWGVCVCVCVWISTVCVGVVVWRSRLSKSRGGLSWGFSQGVHTCDTVVLMKLDF